MARRGRFSPEVRERAVRFWLEKAETEMRELT